jgi:hypothetical protein
MTNKELLQKLNSLKSIQPNVDWKNDNRKILYSQISNSTTPLSPEIHNFNFFRAFKHAVAQPVFVFASISVITIGLLGVNTAYTRPGDSLYIARIISQKAQLAITFNDEQKNKLEFKFANDRAREITQVLSQTDDQGKTDQLAKDFKKEISIVKSKINNLNIADNTASGAQTDPDDSILYSADLGRDDKGLQVSAPNGSIASGNNAVATSTQPLAPHQMLDEAETLFNNKDYAGAENKLIEVDKLINQNSDQTAPATSTNATTTK